MTKALQDIKMRPEAIAACALPMILGLMFGLLEIFSDGRSDWIITLPLSFCFLFGTPLTAWLVCRHLRKAKDAAIMSRWESCVGAGLLGASTVHVSAALLYTLGFFVPDLIEGRPVLHYIPSILFISAGINLCLWMVLTLPFTLFCSTIFWRVTKFPSDTDRF